ncbi:hypothetical protein [Salinimicrobium soli]|uniref:hypothetical protein n=1 Tax=Salinimicrobium soli TaxID=1254399 RepID=UPI003AAA787F
MTIEEAIRKLENSVNSGGTKAEQQLKRRFSNILNELKHKDLDLSQQKCLEEELDLLFSEKAILSGNKKELKASLNHFLKVLRKECSLVPEGYCASNGMIFGMLSGTLVLSFSILYTDSPLKYYAPLAGMIIGMIFGSLCDYRRKKKGRTLLTKMY